MEKKKYIRPLMAEVKIQAANQLLTISNDLGIHNEVSGNNSYARECSAIFFNDDEEYEYE